MQYGHTMYVVLCIELIGICRCVLVFVVSIFITRFFFKKKG